VPERVPVIRLCVVALALFASPRPAAAQRFATGGPYNTPAGASPTAELLRDVGIEQHLDEQLPLDAVFVDETGREVRLGDYFSDKPVVLALVYYKCPMLCTQVLNGFLKSSQAVPLEIGRDFRVVTVSFDSREGADLAAEKKKQYVRAYRREGAAQGWHFLTGNQEAIERLTRSIGFRYHYDPKSGQFAHASGIVIATPDGRLARYFYGIEYSPHDLRLGLVESSAGRIGSPVDQVLLLCYHYDPLTGQYGLAIAGVLRLAGTLTVLGLGCFLVVMYRRERRRPKLVRNSATNGAFEAGQNIESMVHSEAAEKMSGNSLMNSVGSESSTPAGVPAISRGLSEATPPVTNQKTNCTPEGCQQRPSLKAARPVRRIAAATLPGSNSNFGRLNRGCRSAQPPANGCDPSGVGLLATFVRAPAIFCANSVNRDPTGERASRDVLLAQISLPRIHRITATQESLPAESNRPATRAPLRLADKRFYYSRSEKSPKRDLSVLDRK